MTRDWQWDKNKYQILSSKDLITKGVTLCSMISADVRHLEKWLGLNNYRPSCKIINFEQRFNQN